MLITAFAPAAGFARAAVALGALLAAGCLTPRIRYEDPPDGAAPSAPQAAHGAALAAGGNGGPDGAAPATAEDVRLRFLRYSGDARLAGDLESSARVYRRADGAEVLLIAMVHFADPAFSDHVSRRLAGSDVILLEGAAEGPTDGVGPDAPALSAAASIFEALDLVQQPEGEQLGPPGPCRVRGVVDPADLAARVEAVRATGAAWSPQEFPRGLFHWDRFWYAAVGKRAAFRRAWRHLFAQRLRPADERAVRDILIDPRNDALLRALDRELGRRPAWAAAPRRFRVAVPWGSEHMPGIESGVLARGFAFASAEPMLAWRVRSYEVR